MPPSPRLGNETVAAPWAEDYEGGSVYIFLRHDDGRIIKEELKAYCGRMAWKERRKVVVVADNNNKYIRRREEEEEIR